MSNLNKIFLMGRLTRDPELRYTPQGVPVTDLGLAVNREYSAGGERRKDTLFIDVTLWRRQAEVCCQYLKKGRTLFVEGRLSMDTWEGQDGQKRTRYRVIGENFQFIGSGGGGRREDFEGGGPDEELEQNYGSNFRQGGNLNQGARSPSPQPAADREPGYSPEPADEGYASEIADEDIPF